MMKLFSLKKEGAAASSSSGNKPKSSAALLRIQKDMQEINLPSTIKMTFDNPDDLLNFGLIISPDEGFYSGASFSFTFKIKDSYPHDPPKVHCIQKIYHPNIDLQGNVCLNILREDWKPILTISSVIYGLQFLFLEPNPDDPLNKDAAEDLRSDKSRFASNVSNSLKGGIVKDEKFDKLL